MTIQWYDKATVDTLLAGKTDPADITDAVAAAVAALIAGAPGALDTLNELASALGDDASFATTVTNALATKATPAQITSAIAALGLGTASTHAATDFDAAGAAATAQTAAVIAAAADATTKANSAQSAATTAAATDATTKANAAQTAANAHSDAAAAAALAAANAAYAAKVVAAGDITGATDSAAILAALATGACHLVGGQVYWINRQIVFPDNVSWGVVGKGNAIIRQAAGTNLQVPMIVNQNYAAPGGVAGAAPAVTSMNGSISGLIIDVNCTAQDYSGQAWLTAGPNYVNGPDALTICGRDLTIDVDVVNPVRHGIVTADASAGTNTIGLYGGVGDVAGGTGSAKNVYGIKLEYTVSGYALYGGRTTLTGCTTVAGTNTATIPGAAAVKPGMVAYGAGVAPSTIVTSVSGTTVTFSQNLTTNCGTTLYFTWGQRGRWNTAAGAGCTDGWEIGRAQVRSMNGDWMVKFDVSGGWRFGFHQHFASAYGVAQYLWADHGAIVAPTFANLGAGPANIPVQIGGLNAALNASASLTTITLQAAVGVALPQYTPILIPTTGAPLVTVLSAACAAADTTLSVWKITNGSGAQLAIGTAVRIPLVGAQTNGFSGSAVRQTYTSESAGNDYVYHQELSYSTTANGATTFLSQLGALRAQNGSRLDTTNAATGKSVTVTNGSSTVLDNNIAATDSGFPVIGTGIPAASYVSAVTPGVSFVISSSAGSSVPVNANANGTAVSIGLSGSTSVAASFVMQGGSGGTWTVRNPLVLNQGQTACLTTYTTAGAGTYAFPDGLPGGNPTVTAPTPALVVPATPAAINSTSALMVGLANGANPALYTPSLTGTVKVRVSGTGYTAVAKVNWNLTGRWGTGTPPANGGATAGTAFAQGTITFGTAGATNHGEQFMTVALLTGLTVGTPIWVDLAAWTSTLGDAVTFESIVVEFDELV